MGCDSEQKENDFSEPKDKDVTAKYNYNDCDYLKPLSGVSENDMYWLLPTTKIYFNDEIISDGIIQKHEEDGLLTEKYISNNTPYKLLVKELGTEFNDSMYRITYHMELISDYKWFEKEYDDDGILREYEEFIFFNETFCKNGTERHFYRNGQLESDCINYSPDCGDPVNDSPDSFDWDGVCKDYYLNGQIMKEEKFDFKEGRLIYEKCWRQDGVEIDCE